MPKFSDYFSIPLSQHQLDFVDVSNEEDTPVYLDPYAIEIQNDIWAARASNSIRIFFEEVLSALRNGDSFRAANLMSNLREPRETFLGVSNGKPKGRGVGTIQAGQLIGSIENSEAFKTGLLSDLSELALYVEGIDRDKISDLTTNIIRELLVEYTQQQCEIHGVPTQNYNGPAIWDETRKNWVAKFVELPFIEEDPILLVPKYVVRRKLCLNSQEFYNKQITDFLVSENLRANSSLVQVVKGKAKVFKKDVREKVPHSKQMVAEFVAAHPEILEIYKNIAKRHSSMSAFNDDEPSIQTICQRLAGLLPQIPAGAKDADAYHQAVQGALTALFYPNLILPKKEWSINDGRKRVDIVFTNAGDTGFFSQRRDDPRVNANTVIVECKNYSNDIANEELDQLLGRFDGNRGKLGLVTCREIDNLDLLASRCRDAAIRSQGYMIALTDDDIVRMLELKALMKEEKIESILHGKFRDLIA